VPLIHWTPALSVGVEHLDEQHREIVTLINSLDDAMAQGKGRGVLGQILSDLTRYSLWHFSEEEKLFDTLGYPDAAAHVAEHKRFIAEVAKAQADFDSGKQALSIQVIDFLTDWLSTHICGADQKYTALFNEKGVR